MLLPKRAAEEKRRGGERARARSGVEREERTGGMGTGQGGGFPDRDGFHDFDVSEREGTGTGRFSGRRFRMLSSMLSVAIMVRAGESPL